MDLIPNAYKAAKWRVQQSRHRKSPLSSDPRMNLSIRRILFCRKWSCWPSFIIDDVMQSKNRNCAPFLRLPTPPPLPCTGERKEKPPFSPPLSHLVLTVWVSYPSSEGPKKNEYRRGSGCRICCFPALLISTKMFAMCVGTRGVEKKFCSNVFIGSIIMATFGSTL